MEKEIKVYVKKEQSTLYGIWKYFQTINGDSGFYIENDEKELIKVEKENVFEITTNLPIVEYVRLKDNEKVLIRFGLTKEDASIFQTLLDKMTIPIENLNSFRKEMEAGIPFEGGMFFSEALVGLLLDK